MTLSCATDGATIYYTTDGTTPTTSSTAYSSAITVDQTMTIKAKGFKDGLDDSDEASATYTLKCVAPSFSPTAGSVVYNTPITLTSTDGAIIYYTTDDSNPTTSSNVYDSSNKPVIDATKTIKAIAVKDGWDNSDVSSAAYTLKTPDAPSFSLEAGMVSKGASLTLTSEGATIRYTTDGTTPTASVGTVYTEPITINSAQTIKAVAYDAGGNESDVVTKTYTVFVGDVVTFDATSDTGSSSIVKDGVTFTCSNGVLNNASEYRLYKNSNNTFSVTSGKIKKIEFTCKSSYPASGFGSKTGFSTNGYDGVWTGDATSVTFTASNKQVQATLIKVYVAKTAAPTFSVEEGVYDEAKSVTISCATEGATIYYTTNGDTPTSSNTEYTGAISITETTTLKAIAIYDGLSSNVTSATYTMNRPAAPTFNVAACVFNTAFDVQLSTETDGAKIYYTLDGNTPNNSSSEYDTKVTIPTGNNITLKAMAVKNGLTSDVSSVTYTYDARTTPTFSLSSTAVELKVNEAGSVTLTTNYDGTITATSSDADHMPVSYNSSTKVCTFTASQVGNYTITFNATGSDNYMPASQEVAVTVNGTNSISISETSKSQPYTAGTFALTATVPTDNYNGTVTASSSNTFVATVSVDGTTVTVNPVAVGTATITVTAGAGTYYPATASKTCDVTITAPAGGTTAPVSGFNKVTTTEDITNGEYLIVYEEGNVAFNGSLTTLDKSSNTISVTITNDVIAATDATKAATFTIDATAGTIQSKSGYYIGRTANSNGLDSNTATQYTNSFEIDGSGSAVISAVFNGSDRVLQYNKTSGQTRFRYFGSTQEDIQLYKLIDVSETVKLNASGYATYCSLNPLDFSSAEGYSAWQITGVSGTTITFSQISGTIKGGQGILLKGTANETVTLTSANSENVLSNNKLYGTTAPTYAPADTYYGLSGNQFVKVNPGTVKAGKALLPVSELGSNPARLSFVFEDESTTGISDAMHLNDNGEMIDNIYDMQGRKVTNPKKGLYIINGKKTLVK